MRLAVLKNNVPSEVVLVETPDLTERYEIYVGRAEDCHVRIDDPLISRHHFVIIRGTESWLCRKISKLGSVTVGGKDAENIPLTDGDEIKCGAYSVVVTELGDVLRAPQEDDFKEAHTVVVSPSSSLEEDELTEVMAAPVRNEAPLEVTEELSDGLESDSFEELGTPLEESLDDNQQNDFYSSSSDNESLEEPLGESSSSDDFSNDDQGFSEGGDLVAQDDEFGMAALEQDEATRVDQGFVNYELVIFGEHAPYDRYVITEQETYIGRDSNKCQIVLTDPEVSSVHSVLKKNGSIMLLEDLNSSNGTILNGQRINRSAAMPGDEFVIGSTSFTLKVKSDLLNAERDRLMPVEQGQIIETEEIEEELVDSDEADSAFSEAAPVEKSIIKRIWKNPAQRKKLIYVLVGLSLAWLFLDEEKPDVGNQTKAKTAQTKPVDPNQKKAIVLSKELEQKRNTEYELGVAAFELADFTKALPHFETVFSIDSDYKQISSFLKQTKEAIKQLAELEKQRREEEERIKLKKVIEELMVKAREAVKSRQVQVAESYFAQITEKDPENMEVQQLKLELEAWQKEEERLALEKAAKEAARKKMVDSLTPGKTFYLKREWYKAILRLEEFLQKKGMDEDLIKEASDMLSDAKNELASELGPVIGKARSLKEGQDLKAAYESFQEVLKIEPTNSEALNEVDEIKTLLELRSKRVYRDAIIAESLSLFSDAKEKFQEVQQISPSDSEYYKKATEKLRNYLE